MPDFPQSPVTPLFVSTVSVFSGYTGTGTANLQCVSIAWPSANLAIYMPMWIPWPYLVSRVFWGNGSVIATSNKDFGIYTAGGTRIYNTGAVAEAGASAIQYVTPTQFLLSPGRYYFALSCSAATPANHGWGAAMANATVPRLMGLLQEATANPLPATMTGVANTGTAYPLCGITKTASGF